MTGGFTLRSALHNTASYVAISIFTACSFVVLRESVQSSRPTMPAALPSPHPIPEPESKAPPALAPVDLHQPPPVDLRTHTSKLVPNPLGVAIPDAPPATATVEESPKDAVAADRKPVASYTPPPVFPESAWRRGAYGVVVLKLAVDAAGAVTNVAVESGSGDPELDKAALDAIRVWRYEPAVSGGKPVPASVAVEVRFRLSSAIR